MVPYYVLISIFVLFLVSFLFLKHTSNFSATNLPTCWIGWPVIGDSLAFLAAGRDGRPERYFFHGTVKFPASADQEVFKTSLLGEPTAVMCGSAANKFLFSNEEKLVKVWFPSTVAKLFPYSSQTTESSRTETKKVRRLVSHFLRRYVGVMDGVVRPRGGGGAPPGEAVHVRDGGEAVGEPGRAGGGEEAPQAVHGGGGGDIQRPGGLAGDEAEQGREEGDCEGDKAEKGGGGDILSQMLVRRGRTVRERA